MQAWQRALIGTALLLAATQVTGAQEALNRFIADAHWTWRARSRPEPFPPEILVVAIDDKTLGKLGRTASWSRRRYADLLTHLGSARAVAFDILFPDAAQDSDGDLAFAQAIQANGRVVLPYNQWNERRPINRESQERTRLLRERLPRAPGWLLEATEPVTVDTLEPPLPSLLRAAKGIGYADVTADSDGVFRTANLVKPTNEGTATVHFSVALAALARDRTVEELLSGRPVPGSDRVLLAPLRGTIPLHPIARRGGRLQARVGQGSDLQTPAGQPVPQISFVDALETDPERFRDKIVLVGETATGTTDVRPNPLDTGLRGVELNAEILANLLHVQPARPLPLLLQWMFILLAAGLPLWLFARYDPRIASLGTLAVLLVSAGGLEGAFWLAERVPAWAPVLVALIGSTMGMGLQSAVHEHSLKQQIRAQFSQFVSPKLVQQLIRNQEIGPSRQRVAVLFSDVRDFTPYSERTAPELVVRQMREYLDDMATAVVDEQDGVLDKFIGDAVMALFGPFLEPGTNVSARAVACGVSMLNRLDAINARWAQEGLEPFRIGIGIHVGDAVVGIIGTDRRQQLTALGDTVNLAARLETATKEVGATLLVTEAVREEAAPELGRLVEFADRGEIRVKGKEQPVRVYEVRRAATAVAGAPRSLGTAVGAGGPIHGS